jgi:hypothetical protein
MGGIGFPASSLGRALGFASCGGGEVFASERLGKYECGGVGGRVGEAEDESGGLEGGLGEAKDESGGWKGGVEEALMVGEGGSTNMTAVEKDGRRFWLGVLGAIYVGVRAGSMMVCLNLSPMHLKGDQYNVPPPPPFAVCTYTSRKWFTQFVTFVKTRPGILTQFGISLNSRKNYGVKDESSLPPPLAPLVQEGCLDNLEVWAQNAVPVQVKGWNWRRSGDNGCSGHMFWSVRPLREVRSGSFFDFTPRLCSSLSGMGGEGVLF